MTATATAGGTCACRTSTATAGWTGSSTGTPTPRSEPGTGAGGPPDRPPAIYGVGNHGMWASTVRSRAVSLSVQPGGASIAAHASATLSRYRWPCPGGTVVEVTASTVTCQNVTSGYQRMAPETPGPRLSSSHAGSR